MVRRVLASSSVLLAALANVGCGPPAATDAGVFVITEDPPVSGISLAYVIRAITIPDGTSEVTPGFDLDGRVSDGTSTATCEDRHADTVNGIGQLGVDNRLGPMLTSLATVLPELDVQARADADLASGVYLLAITVNDLNNFENDSSVTIDLSLVDPAGCMASPCAPSGGVVADASWATRLRYATGLAGTLEDGVLLATLPQLFLGDGVVVRDATLSARITRSGLTDGQLGGRLGVAELIEAAEPDDREAVGDILAEHADLQPSDADVLACTSISSGIGFTAVLGTVD